MRCANPTPVGRASPPCGVPEGPCAAMDSQDPGAASQQSDTIAATGVPATDLESKRLKKLEQNRLAAQQSRQRKKQRTEELQRHILELQQQNHELERMRGSLYGRLTGDCVEGILPLMDQLHAENSALKYTLYQRLQECLFRSDRMYPPPAHMLYRQLQAHASARGESTAEDPKDSRARGSNAF